MNTLNAKIIAGVGMLLAIFLFFVLPIKLRLFIKKKGARGLFYLDLLSCFAGGVFLAVYLIFMVPDVKELILEHLMIPNNITYPLADFFIGCGFFFMLIFNRVIVSLCHSIGSKKHFPPEFCKSPSHTSEIITTKFHKDVQTFSSIKVVIENTVLEKIPPFDSNSEKNQQESMARSIVMMLALSFDSVLEGLTTGLKDSTNEVWAIFVGNLIHESIIAFCLGLQLIKTNEKRKLLVVLAAVTYSLMNPIGLIIATVLYELNPGDQGLGLASGVLQSVVAGCFIYVTFCEILDGQLSQQTPYSKIIAMLLGFAFLAAFGAMPGDNKDSIGKHLSNCTS